MPYSEDKWAECPRCKKHADGKEEIDSLFGYRTMEDGKVIPQSHCRQCRKEELKQSRQ